MWVLIHKQTKEKQFVVDPSVHDPKTWDTIELETVPANLEHYDFEGGKLVENMERKNRAGAAKRDKDTMSRLVGRVEALEGAVAALTRP